MAPIKRQFICSIPDPYVFFLLTITHAGVGFRRLLEQYNRKFQDEKNPGILQDFRHGCEDPISYLESSLIILVQRNGKRGTLGYSVSERHVIGKL